VVVLSRSQKGWATICYRISSRAFTWIAIVAIKKMLSFQLHIKFSDTTPTL
jgi:hypothetical protein